MRTAALLLLGTAAAFALQEPGPQPPDDVLFERDVVYGKGGGEDLKLNLARPRSVEGRPFDPAQHRLPCVVVIHGGGWAAGRKEAHDNLTWEFARRGYVSATVGYRLVPKALFPAQIEDVKCAVRFLRAHADKFGIDPERIGAMGFSAGGHLSMMLGVMGKEDGLEGEGGWADQSSQVQAVVNFFGPTDFVSADFPEASRGIVARWIGGTRQEKPEEYRRASPITYVSKGDAPILHVQGTQDALVPHSQVYVMVDAMTAAGVPGRAELIVGAGHGWGPPELARTLEATYAFFDRYLKRGAKK
jgi:acetyl esterase/lipase